MYSFRWVNSLWFIIVCGAFFRVYNLLERGPFKVDGIVYWRVVVKAVQENIFLWYYAKPGHIFLMWLFTIPFGLKPFVPVLVSLVTGLLTILTVYFLARRLYSHEIGLISAAVLAVSPWHVEYSREALSLANATFFWILFLILYLKSRPDADGDYQPDSLLAQSYDPKRLWIVILSGICLGFAFSCHYNIGLMPLAIFISLFTLSMKPWTVESV